VLSPCWLGVPPQLVSDAAPEMPPSTSGELAVDRHGWLALQLSLATTSSASGASAPPSLDAEPLPAFAGARNARKYTRKRTTGTKPGAGGAASQWMTSEVGLAAVNARPCGAGGTLGATDASAGSDHSDGPTLLHARTRAAMSRPGAKPSRRQLWHELPFATTCNTASMTQGSRRCTVLADLIKRQCH
jgi:hypothetical protein